MRNTLLNNGQNHGYRKTHDHGQYIQLFCVSKTCYRSASFLLEKQSQHC